MELDSLRIGRRQYPAPKRGWRSPPAGADDLYRDYDRAFLTAPAEQPVEATTEGWRHTDFEDTAPITKISLESAAAAFDDNAMEPAPELEEERCKARPMPQQAPMGPPPPPMSLPDEPPMMMPVAGKQAGGWGARLSRSQPGKSTRHKKLKQEEDSSRISAGAYRDKEADELDVVQTSPDLLSYGTLRMPSAGSAHRGHLTAVAKTQIYLELLVDQRVEVSVDTLGVALQGAAKRSWAVEQAALPPRCEPAWSEDYDYAYVAESPIEVPSDGDFHSIPIRSASAAAKPRYVTVPRESTDVYRMVELENPLDAPLLPGPIDVYWKGDFLLTGKVAFTPPKATLRLGLGVEQAIKVSRNTRFREESAGLMGGSLDLRHQISMEALNHTEREVHLEVRERIPVIRDDEEEIRIELEDVSPPWEPFDPFPSSAGALELRGGYRWRLRLKSGAREDLRVRYTVRIPAKLELVGGNRREV